MAVLSTGPIENNPVNGTRLTQLVTVRIVNRDPVSSSYLLILGYVLGVSREFYVIESIEITANGVVSRNYFADLNAFEFLFITDGVGEQNVAVSVWGKDASGQLVDAHRIVTQEKVASEDSLE
ncbi:hypothetical protein [Paenibacillus albidus]|nr:hypothetical protein [Paenibacillus albidus]